MNELDWLTERRPDVAEPDEGTTAYARTALLAYSLRSDDATDRELPSRERVTAVSRPPRRRPRKAPLYALAVAVFAIAIVVGASALPSSKGPAHTLGAPAVAEAALVKFSKRIAAEPAPTGDATLVVRHHSFPDDEDITGTDLYLDDGHYYFAPTLAGLRGGGESTDTGTDVINRQVLAAKAAIGLAPDEARKGMVAAIMGDTKMRPGVKSTRELDDNHIWGACLDALVAGAGNTQVRAGVMRLLATIPSVKVEDHGATLALRNTAVLVGYEETLTVDAKTGVIQKMVGRNVGGPPAVTVTYETKRVEARDVIG
jgi:hypothetical protein